EVEVERRAGDAGPRGQLLDGDVGHRLHRQQVPGAGQDRRFLHVALALRATPTATLRGRRLGIVGCRHGCDSWPGRSMASPDRTGPPHLVGRRVGRSGRTHASSSLTTWRAYLAALPVQLVLDAISGAAPLNAAAAVVFPRSW